LSVDAETKAEVVSYMDGRVVVNYVGGLVEATHQVRTLFKFKSIPISRVMVKSLYPYIPISLYLHTGAVCLVSCEVTH